jgi:hypothetical protein
MPETGTVPLLYPAHFAGQNIEWPKPGWPFLWLLSFDHTKESD